MVEPEFLGTDKASAESGRLLVQPYKPSMNSTDTLSRVGLDNVHTHTLGGFLGDFLTGIFATKAGCAAFAITTPGGAIEGNGRQVWVQIVGAIFILGLNLFMTSLILVSSFSP